ncbi:MAG TPA: nitroreductase/quinone reductase family protein [Dermatophilaceae bacterium]|nr:nitroreductase/quinone reductase family protein [Dermatophilaceae bacterium]
MVYLKPPARITKIFNKLAMHGTVGDVHTLEVARRNAVDPQRVPVIPLELEGSLFVVSTGGEADWVKNVRAAGRVRLGQKGQFETYATTEVPADGRADILKAYRKKVGREVNGYRKRLPGATDHPTFKLTPGLPQT